MTSNTPSTDRSGSVRGGDFSSKLSMPENIYAFEPTHTTDKTLQSTVFPPGQEEIAYGERADYLPEFTRAVGGTVTLDRRGHRASARIFGGSKAARTHTAGHGEPFHFHSTQGMAAYAGVWGSV